MLQIRTQVSMYYDDGTSSFRAGGSGLLGLCDAGLKPCLARIAATPPFIDSTSESRLCVMFRDVLCPVWNAGVGPASALLMPAAALARAGDAVVGRGGLARGGVSALISMDPVPSGTAADGDDVLGRGDGVLADANDVGAGAFVEETKARNLAGECGRNLPAGEVPHCTSAAPGVDAWLVDKPDDAGRPSLVLEEGPYWRDRGSSLGLLASAALLPDAGRELEVCRSCVAAGAGAAAGRVWRVRT
mmetsp:Transcript_20989/g.45973  ORF Transcript_20989/g.45973 Transcript_20989/m.45973 type:complete len:245 (+) Transcript_20989:331-1065(+)